LKSIESGEINKAEKILNELKSTNPNDPSVLFLDAVLTKDGEASLNKYMIVYQKYPKSNYADAALYRIFSYYFSSGLYKKAEDYLTKLKNEYPNSPYIKSADRSIPDEEEAAATQEQPSLKTEKPITPAAQIDSANFTVQAGAFLNTDNAKKLSDQLQDAGYSTQIKTKEVGGSILNVVTVGRFDTESEAEPVLNFLKQKFNLNGRVVQLSEQ
jgi:tetratricopeptide (TPR) repeat protein